MYIVPIRTMRMHMFIWFEKTVKKRKEVCWYSVTRAQHFAQSESITLRTSQILSILQNVSRLRECVWTSFKLFPILLIGALKVHERRHFKGWVLSDRIYVSVPSRTTIKDRGVCGVPPPEPWHAKYYVFISSVRWAARWQGQLTQCKICKSIRIPHQSLDIIGGGLQNIL